LGKPECDLTARINGVLGHQLDVRVLTHLLDQAFDHPQVELADGVRVACGHIGERAAAQDEAAAVGRGGSPGLEPGGSKVLFEPGHGASSGSERPGSPAPGALPYRSRVVPSSKDLGKKRRQQLVGGLGAPRTGHVGVEPVEQARPSGASTHLGLLHDEFGALEHRQVLADGVVVEPQQRRQLSHPNGPPGSGDVAKDPVPGRVAEGSSSALEGILLGLQEWTHSSSVDSKYDQRRGEVARMTKTQAYEAILRHHALLGERMEERVRAVRRAVDQVPLGQDGHHYEPAVAELVAFLGDEILPHASAEEQTIYPTAAAQEGLTEVVDEMIGEHERLVSLTEQLASATSGFAAAGTRDEIAELFVAHVGKENDILLPPLVADDNVDLAGLPSHMHDLTEASQDAARTEDEFSALRLEEALLSVFLQAADDLSQVGKGDRACELAAAAWRTLRGVRPDLAVRVTAALHRLARQSTSVPVTFRAGADGAGAEGELDVRTLAPAKRHETIFATYDGLGAGGAFVLVNDHDPKPLYYQFEAEHPGTFSWDYLESGPRTWRVRIGRVGAGSSR
jgi:uncharacterized protein (DUF2249 family)/iron-sulfur cluster repair protein YtfE (RIC family)